MISHPQKMRGPVRKRIAAESSLQKMQISRRRPAQSPRQLPRQGAGGSEVSVVRNGGVPCMAMYRSGLRARGKSNDSGVSRLQTLTPVSLARQIGRGTQRWNGPPKLRRISLRLLEPVSATRRGGYQVNLSRRFVSSRLSLRKSSSVNNENRAAAA